MKIRGKYLAILATGAFILGAGVCFWKCWISLSRCDSGAVRLAYAIDDGQAFVVRACGNTDRLDLVDPVAGLLWSAELPGVYWGPIPGADPPLTTFEDGVFTIRVRKNRDEGPNIHVGFDAKTGRQIWQSHPFDWREKIGSFTASFPNVIIDSYWDHIDGVPQNRYKQHAYDRKTGKLLWSSELPLTLQWTFQTPNYLVFARNEWNILRPQDGQIVHRFRARGIESAAYADGFIYYLSPDGINALSLDNFTEKRILAGRVEQFDRFAVGLIDNSPAFYVPQRSGQPVTAPLFTVPGFRLFLPLFVRLGTVMRRDLPFPLFGKLTPFIAVMAEPCRGDMKYRLVMFELANSTIAWQSRIFKASREPDVLKHGNKYFVLWDEVLQKNGNVWLLMLDGETGQLCKAVAAPSGLTINPHNFGGSRLWLREQFSNGHLAVLDTNDLAVVHTTNQTWTFLDVTQEARSKLQIESAE